jgi:hypothetical protein
MLSRTYKHLQENDIFHVGDDFIEQMTVRYIGVFII